MMNFKASINRYSHTEVPYALCRDTDPEGIFSLEQCLMYQNKYTVHVEDDDNHLSDKCFLDLMRLLLTNVTQGFYKVVLWCILLFL
jgi:hypothetical protein